MEIKKIISKHLDSNTFVIKENNSALIIDAGAEVEEIIESVGDAKVEAVLLTHGHYDHVMNCNELAKKYNCKIYINENAKETLVDPKLNYGETFKIEDLSKFEYTQGDCNLKFDNFFVNVIHTPGHSICSNSYLIENNLFSGDFLFSGGIGRVDLITSNVKEMIESLDKIDNVIFEKCFCGHYDDSTKERIKQVVKVYKKFLEREKK